MDTNALLPFVFLGLYSALALLRSYHALRIRAAQTQARVTASHHEIWTSLLRVLLVLGLSCAVTLYGFFHTYGVFPWLGAFELPLHPALRWMGCVGAWAALAGLHWVHRTLGSFFSVRLEVRDDHALVRSGPYAYVRHPMYTALLAFFLFAALASANAFIVAWSVGLMCFLYARIAPEERLLCARFGDEYRVYMKESGRLLPRLTLQK